MIQAKAYAAQTPETDLAPWDFERREVGPHDVQIEIQYCGVCHSDLHQIKNDWFPGIFPMVPGHEIVGKIIKVGDHVKKFKVNELAGVGCMVDSCQVCETVKTAWSNTAWKAIPKLTTTKIAAACLPMVVIPTLL
ncbi:D-arabinose 1-dehydrogenase-like Zn-dependent alcohol dehydrogenase [Mucilaginibacter sp. SG564]|nr:D-arabinose 1-dehydrogenase-like Zn-dependent alcohol dehydrogenase [Mucilaginibacter sp. SG564]